MLFVSMMCLYDISIRLNMSSTSSSSTDVLHPVAGTTPITSDFIKSLHTGWGSTICEKAAKILNEEGYEQVSSLKMADTQDLKEMKVPALVIKCLKEKDYLKESGQNGRSIMTMIMSTVINTPAHQSAIITPIPH